ncbi:protein LURP-one-related 12-like [Populus alba x Populus x berolinensis]|uniref:Protein LURP-one-related 12-like n=1 Tax=Populus alba x Populus x berolinensis TaxID=444605 RepID=A0AAD6R5R1_9ROSI|nr:protein LURP-one-related 12-like [Populus alba x Populus x berolinensis]
MILKIYFGYYHNISSGIGFYLNLLQFFIEKHIIYLQNHLYIIIIIIIESINLYGQRPSLHQRWEGYIGEGTDGSNPIFSVRRTSMIGRCTVTVEVCGNPGEEYQIEGSFATRSCTILNTVKEAVAEIRRKVDASTDVVLGKDVLSLCLKPGFDGAFAMGLVLILDQINGYDSVENEVKENSATED